MNLLTRLIPKSFSERYTAQFVDKMNYAINEKETIYKSIIKKQ